MGQIQGVLGQRSPEQKSEDMRVAGKDDLEFSLSDDRKFPRACLIRKDWLTS